MKKLLDLIRQFRAWRAARAFERRLETDPEFLAEHMRKQTQAFQDAQARARAKARRKAGLASWETRRRRQALNEQTRIDQGLGGAA